MGFDMLMVLAEGGASTLTHPPLSFVRSDAVNIRDGKIWYLGVYGNGWSRVSKNATNSYLLTMGPTHVGPSYSYDRWGGFPLRS